MSRLWKLDLFSVAYTSLWMIRLSTQTKTNDWLLAQQTPQSPSEGEICRCRDVLLISHLVTYTWLALFPAVASPSALCGGDFLHQSIALKMQQSHYVAGLIRAQGRGRSTFSLFSQQSSCLLNNFGDIWKERRWNLCSKTTEPDSGNICQILLTHVRPVNWSVQTDMLRNCTFKHNLSFTFMFLNSSLPFMVNALTWDILTHKDPIL